GGGIADVLCIGHPHIHLAHEVDEHFGGLLVLAGGGDAHAVHRQHAAFFREDPGQVGVVVDHGDGVPRIVYAHSRLAADHLVEDLVHDIGLHQRLLRFELLHHLIHFIGGGRVDAPALLEGGDGVGVPAVVEHQDASGILFIPQVGPAGGRLADHGGIVNDAGGAQHIGHRIGVFGVVIGVAVLLVDQL